MYIYSLYYFHIFQEFIFLSHRDLQTSMALSRRFSWAEGSITTIIIFEKRKEKENDSNEFLS